MSRKERQTVRDVCSLKLGSFIIETIKANRRLNYKVIFSVHCSVQFVVVLLVLIQCVFLVPLLLVGASFEFLSFHFSFWV